MKLTVTLEEHNVFGGFGSAVAEALSEIGSAAPLMRIGIPDLFVGVGDREDLIKLHKMDPESVVKRIEERLGSL